MVDLLEQTTRPKRVTTAATAARTELIVSPNFCVTALTDTSCTVAIVGMRDASEACVLFTRKAPGTKWSPVPMVAMTIGNTSNLRLARVAFLAGKEAAVTPVALATWCRAHGGKQMVQREGGKYEYAFLAEAGSIYAIATVGDKVLESGPAAKTDEDAIAALNRVLDKRALSWPTKDLIAWLQAGKPISTKKVEATAVTSIKSLANPGETIPEVVVLKKLSSEEKAALKAARAAKKAEKAAKKAEKIAKAEKAAKKAEKK